MSNRHPTPRFRTGTKRVILNYVKLGPSSEQAFTNLIENGENHIVYSYQIALAMSDKPLKEGVRTVRGRQRRGPIATVLPRQANLYRRAWDALGLVSDFPGKWNPEKFSPAKFDHDELGEGYQDYTDWTDQNEPAELYLNTSDPLAYSQMIEGHDIYVLNRNVVATDVYDIEAVAYGESNMLISCEWNLIPGHPILGGVQPQDITEDSSYLCSIHKLHTPSTVILLKNQEEMIWSNRRSRSPTCLMALLQRPVSVPELVEMTGTPRRTVYDRIKKGKAIKIEEGQYWCVCHPMSEYVDLAMDREQERAIESTYSQIAG